MSLNRKECKPLGVRGIELKDGFPLQEEKDDRVGGKCGFDMENKSVDEWY